MSRNKNERPNTLAGYKRRGCSKRKGNLSKKGPLSTSSTIWGSLNSIFTGNTIAESNWEDEHDMDSIDDDDLDDLDAKLTRSQKQERQASARLHRDLKKEQYKLASGLVVTSCENHKNFRGWYKRMPKYTKIPKQFLKHSSTSVDIPHDDGVHWYCLQRENTGIIAIIYRHSFKGRSDERQWMLFAKERGAENGGLVPGIYYNFGRETETADTQKPPTNGWCTPNCSEALELVNDVTKGEFEQDIYKEEW